MNDLISRQHTVDALWKALYDYEDKTEKQFLESEELNVDDWFRHRSFVQNMSDIDIQTVLKMPSVDSVEVVRCKDCRYRPTGTGCDHDLEFPVHYKCPCECDDNWYSWMPKDDFFCGNGERKTDVLPIR